MSRSLVHPSHQLLYANGRDFRVGDPVNGRVYHPHEGIASRCRCEGWEYDGSDPRLRWPEGWHVNPRDGRVGGGEAGDFHVNCETFAPDRCRVIRDTHKARNVLFLQGGSEQRPGKVMLAHWFDVDGPLRDIHHADGLTVGIDMVFLLLTSKERHYCDAEMRGMLNVPVHKNESVECLGFHFGENLMVAYWLNAVPDSHVEEARRTIHVPFTLLHDRWYHLDMRLTPLPAQPDTWVASIVLRQPQKIVWQWTSEEGMHPNNIRAVSQVAGGDERGGDLVGGPLLFRRFEAYTEVPA